MTMQEGRSPLSDQDLAAMQHARYGLRHVSLEQTGKAAEDGGGIASAP